MDPNNSSPASGAPDPGSSPLTVPLHNNGNGNGNSNGHSNGHSNGNGNGTSETREPVITWNLDCYKRYESTEYPGLYQYRIDTENELETITDQPTLDALAELGNQTAYIYKLMAQYTFDLWWYEFSHATLPMDAVKELTDRRQLVIRGHEEILNSLIRVRHGIELPDTYVMPPPDDVDQWIALLGGAIMKFKRAARLLNSRFSINDFFAYAEQLSRNGTSDELAKRTLALGTVRLRYFTHPPTSEGDEEIEEALDGPWPPLAQ